MISPSTDARRLRDNATPRLVRTSGTGPRLSFFAASLAGALIMPSFGVAAVITGTRTEGPNVTVSSDSTGLTAAVGRWDTPYTQVYNELLKHDMTTLTVQPAGSHGPHVRGIAFDANVTVANMDTLASHCGLFRPFPRPRTPSAPHCDPTHYQLR